MVQYAYSCVASVCVLKWVRVLYILCEVSHSCQLARSDPLAMGEMALRFTAALESRLSSVHQPGRKLGMVQSPLGALW